LQLAIGVAISAICLAIAFRSVELRGLRDVLVGAHYWWLMAYPVLALALNFTRAEIWRIMLRKRARISETFWAYCVGALVNNVLPLRLGEGARVAVLAVHARIPVAEVAAAAAIERVLDLVAVMAILVMTLPFVIHSRNITYAAFVSTVSAAIAVIGLVVLIVARRPLDRLVRWLSSAIAPGWSHVLVARWNELSHGFAVIGQPGVAAPVVAGATLVWILTVLLQWTVLRAFQPQAQMIDAASFVGTISIAGAVPAAPGGIGTYQWVGRETLTTAFPLRYSPTLALAIALASHAASYVFSTVMGAVGAWYFGLPLARLLKTTNTDPVMGGDPAATGLSRRHGK
jgi:uncharacterized protein (TIRG00374 family)